MVTTAPNGTVSSFLDGCVGFPTLNDQDKVVQYPNGETVQYADYSNLVQLLNPNVSFPKAGWVHIVGDKLAIKCSNKNKVYTEQQMNQLIEKERDAARKYLASSRGKKTAKQYRESDRGRQNHRERQKRYEASDKGKTTIANYNKKTSRARLPKPVCDPICFDDIANVTAMGVPVHGATFSNISDKESTNDAAKADDNGISQMLNDSNTLLKEATSSNFNTMVRGYRETLRDVAESQNKSLQDMVKNQTSCFQNMIGSHKELAQGILGSQNTLVQNMIGSHKESLQSTTDSIRDGIIDNVKVAIQAAAIPLSPPNLSSSSERYIEPSTEMIVNSNSCNDSNSKTTPHELQVECSSPRNAPPPSPERRIESSTEMIVNSSSFNDSNSKTTPHELQVECSSPRSAPPPSPERHIETSTEMVASSNNRNDSNTNTLHELQVERSSPSVIKKKSVRFDPVEGEDTDNVKVKWLHFEMKLREATTIDEVGKTILHIMTDSDHEHLRRDLAAFLCDWKPRSQQKSIDLQKAMQGHHKMAQEIERLRRQVSTLKSGLPMDKHEMMGKIRYLVGKNHSLESDNQRLRRERDDGLATIIALKGKNAALSDEARNHHRQHQRRNMPFSPVKQGRRWSPIIENNKAANDRYQQSEHGQQQQLLRKEETKENRHPSHQQRQEHRQWPRQAMGQEDEEYPDDELPESRCLSQDQQPQQQGCVRDQAQQVQPEYRDDNSTGLRRSRHLSTEEEEGIPPSKKLKH